MTAQRDILVVEDDEAIATGLSLNLRLAGHRGMPRHFDIDDAVLDT